MRLPWDTPATDLTVTGSSSDQTLVPDANILLGDTDASRTIQVTPAANQSGSTTITVSVSDGTDTASDTFVLTVTAVNDPPTISDIPNQTTAEDTPTAAISFTVDDVDTAVGDLTVAGSSSNQTLLPDANIVPGGTEANRTVQITPAANQSGKVTITVAVSDGTDTASTSFALTVTPVNDPPTISNISDQTANQNTPTGAISFTVGDAETAAGSLTVTSSSSNQTLVPDANINVGGTGANRTVQVTPAANQSGSTTITIRVSDAAVAATDTFVLTVSDTTFAIASTDPQGGGVNFAVNGEIQVDFGEPLNPATAANSISVQGARPYTGQVRIENNLLIFRSNEIFGDEESIQITVTTTVQDAAGNALGQDFTFSVTTGFGVWPGDTNNDARVNLLDIIPIARFFNQPSGIARPEPRATAWAVQPVPPWPAKSATYADANGDGLINADDITPVADNWLQTRPASPASAPSPDVGVKEVDGLTTLDIYERMLDALDRHAAGRGEIGEGVRVLRTWLRTEILRLRKQYIPDQTRLLPNYPNPFNPETWIPYQLAEDGDVHIHIYDLNGRRVRTLDLGHQTMGYYVQRDKAAYWDGRNNLGESLASGIYIYQFVAGSYTQMRRLVIVK